MSSTTASDDWALREFFAEFKAIEKPAAEIAWLESRRGSLGFWRINVDGLIKGWRHKH
jgi:hypothetical protein